MASRIACCRRRRVLGGAMVSSSRIPRKIIRATRPGWAASERESVGSSRRRRAAMKSTKTCPSTRLSSRAAVESGASTTRVSNSGRVRLKLMQTSISSWMASVKLKAPSQRASGQVTENETLQAFRKRSASPSRPACEWSLLFLNCDARTMSSTIWIAYYIGSNTCPHSDSSFLSSSSPPSRLSPRLLRASPRRLNPYPPTPPPCPMSPPSNTAIPGSNSGSSLWFPYGSLGTGSCERNELLRG
jgi:hypothetical protein